MLPQACFLHHLHVQQCAFVCILILHSSLSQLILVPSVMLPKNITAITLPSRCYSPSLPFYTGSELIRKTCTHWLQSLSTEKLSLLHGWNFIFICLFYNCPYHYLSWLLRWPTTNARGSFSTERTCQRWGSYHPSQLLLFCQARHEAISIRLNTSTRSSSVPSLSYNY